MFKGLKEAYGTFNKLQQVFILLGVFVCLLLMLQGALWAYKYSVKKDVLVDIKQQEKVFKDEDEKRVKNASSNLSGVADCLKLSSVYKSDQCAQRQNAPENDIPETTAAAEQITQGVRPTNAVVVGLPLPLGSVLSGDTKDKSLCYDTPVMDEFGLPYFVYDGGEWVHEMIKVCPE